jgi:hypothetical protein
MRFPLRLIVIALILSLSGYVIFSLSTGDRSAGVAPSSHETENPQRAVGGDDALGTMGGKSSTRGKRPSRESGAPVLLDLSEARKRLEGFRLESKDVIDHAEFAANLVVELCKSGRTQDAWEFIEQNSGQMRNMQLREFFKNADLDRSELLARLSALEYKLDLQRGLEGYFLRIKPSKYLEEFATPEVMALRNATGESSSDALRRAMNSLIDDLYGRRESLKYPPDEATVSELVSSLGKFEADGMIKSHEIADMILPLSIDSFLRWEILRKHASDPDGLGEGARRQLIGSMIVNDPTKAMGAILAAPGDAQPQNVDLAIHEWLGADSGSLMTWYEGNRGSFEPRQQSLVASAFAKSAILGSEFGNARKWAAEIQDPQIKERTFKAISDKEIASQQPAPGK